MPEQLQPITFDILRQLGAAPERREYDDDAIWWSLTVCDQQLSLALRYDVPAWSWLVRCGTHQGTVSTLPELLDFVFGAGQEYTFQKIINEPITNVTIRT